MAAILSSSPNPLIERPVDESLAQGDRDPHRAREWGIHAVYEAARQRETSPPELSYCGFRCSGRYPPDMDRDEILRVLRAFEASGLEYVLIGATAMGFHGLVRATEDLDLFIRATAENIERLRAALRASYADDPNIEAITAADLLGDYPAVRYYPPSGDLYFDILTRLGEVASFETVDAETKEIEGARVRVATPLALYRLKKDTVRPKDHEDAAALRERFNLKDAED
jgi:hypothetical protein